MAKGCRGSAVMAAEGLDLELHLGLPSARIAFDLDLNTTPSSPAQEKVCLGSAVVVGPKKVIRSKRTSVWGRRLELVQEKGPKFESVHKINSCCSLQTRDIISKLGIASTDVQQH